MQDDKRNELYEKLYFHEVDARDKVVARLQIPLALLFSGLSIFAVLIKGVSSLQFEAWHLFFYAPFGISVVLFIVSSTYFVGAFYNHGYSFMPSANKIEDYRKVLIDHYAEFDDAEENVNNEFSNFIYGYFNNCSSQNTAVNDLRSERIHRCNRFLLFSSIPLLISFLVFTFTSMGVHKDKEYLVKLNGPISIEYPLSPIKVQGEFSSTTLKVDFSHDIKEMINDRRQKGGTSTTASTTD